MQRKNNVMEGVTQLLTALGVDVEKDENFIGTPRRVANYFLEHFVSEDTIQRELRSFKAATFPSSYKGIVIVSDVQVNGMCPHHLLNVSYRIDMAYLPRDRVVGLSKMARIAKLYGCQPILQEDLTEAIADALEKTLETENVAVVVRGKHSCMHIRGVEQPNSEACTNIMRGKFLLNDAGLKEEFTNAISLKRNN
jgi:GTP cyclohydrolase I